MRYWGEKNAATASTENYSKHKHREERKDMCNFKMQLLVVLMLSYIAGWLVMYLTQNLIIGCFTSTLLATIYIYKSDRKKEH